MEVLRVLALGSENEDGDDPTADKKQGCVQSSNQLLMHSRIWKFGSNAAAVTILDCCVKELELKKKQFPNAFNLFAVANRFEHQH